jgi:thiol-disulfide isomerase/thioredoxin
MKVIKLTMKIVGLTVLVFCIGFSFSKIAFSSKTETAAITPGKVYEIVELGTSNEGKMTDFFFNDDEGNKFSLMDITKGKYTFLNFWGTWCPPCRDEIPDIIELQTELKNEGLMVVGVALERDASPMKVVTNYANSKKINYINFVASKELMGKLTATYNGIAYVPTTLLANKSGEIFERIQGRRSKEQFKLSLDKLMQ